MADIDTLWKILKAELLDMVAGTGEEMARALLADGRAFLDDTREDLQRWLNLLEEGRISRDEFEYLVGARKDLLQMEALKQLGLARARIDELRRAVIDAVAGAAVRLIT